MSVLAEEESALTAALRAELEEELRNKKQCTYQSYECTQLCLEGYKFCSKHILQDKNAPFKQCSYVFSSNGKRCHLPAPRSDKKDFGYCNEHALRATLTRNKQNAKIQPPKTAEVLLLSLSHYIKKPKNHTASLSFNENDNLAIDENTEERVTKYNDPFVDLDASSLYNEHCNEILDFCSESESDVEPSTLSSVWHDSHADSSDDESIDSEQEDPLKHANVYTAEEVTLIIRDKLIKLQSLYVEQYRHLQYLLKEKRRKYLHALKREKETCCNIHSQIRDNPKEQRLYKKLKALNNYQKVHGTDAILSKRLKDLRAKTNDASVSKPHPSLKCIFTEGGVKCGERTLPLTKYCKKHILEDPNQVLFRACGKVNDDVECTTPIVAIFDESTCQLHMDVPLLKSYNQTRKDSESDVDDTCDNTKAANYSTDNFTEDIKHEFVPYDIPPELPKMETLPSLLFEENSQSLSESTISQNEIFSMTDPNLQSDTNINMDFKDVEKPEMGFYQISESCTIAPSTSGLISISNSDLNSSQQFQSEPQVSVSSDFQIKQDISDSPEFFPVGQLEGTSTSELFMSPLVNNENIAGPSKMPELDKQTVLSEIEHTPKESNICEEDSVQFEETIGCGESSDLQPPPFMGEMGEVEIKFTENNDTKTEEYTKEIEKMEENEGDCNVSDDCKMDVCTNENLEINEAHISDEGIKNEISENPLPTLPEN